METTEKLIDKLFNNLDNWRKLPAYQLERRADIFFSLYLDKIFKEKYKVTLDFVIPEFPIRIGSIDDNKENSNQSFKIDYVAVCEEENTVYFIELKTDQNSLREEQTTYLKQAKEKGIKIIVDGVIAIYRATTQKRKYRNLLDEISKAGWLLVEKQKIINNSKDYKVEIIYIQPVNDNNSENVISFDFIANLIEKDNNHLAIRFAASLRRWVHNPNKQQLETEKEIAEIEIQST